ncbi:MAG: hypothetical protein V4447_10485 [Pseudomonadota bacterium]
MSDDSINAEFVLTVPAEAKEMWSFLMLHAGRCAKEGNPLHVLIQQEQADAYAYQRNAYFGYILRPIAEQVRVNGMLHSVQSWHHYYAEKFLPLTEIALPNGQIITRRQSIAKGHISAKAMAKLSLETSADAATEFGVVFPERQQ